MTKRRRTGKPAMAQVVVEVPRKYVGDLRNVVKLLRGEVDGGKRLEEWEGCLETEKLLTGLVMRAADVDLKAAILGALESLAKAEEQVSRGMVGRN